MKHQKYYTMEYKPETNSADIYIFGSITSWPWESLGEKSSYGIVKELAEIPSDAEITVHINSNGGEVKEGLGIYNVLKTRNVTTICDGFAASAASVVFCAGKKRIMNPASLLFIHQASMLAIGNADDLEKDAMDLRTITESVKQAYFEAGVTLSDEELTGMLKDETWLTSEAALEHGFATQIAEVEDDGAVRNDAMQSIVALVKARTPEPAGDPLKEVMEAINGLSEKIDALNNTTIPSPITPAKVENKGFFGFGKAGN